MDHTVLRCYLQLHQCLPLPRKRSPDGASPDWGCGHLISACYSFIYPERMKGWVGLVGLPIADGLPTYKWSAVSCRSSAGQGKFTGTVAHVFWVLRYTCKWFWQANTDKQNIIAKLIKQKLEIEATKNNPRNRHHKLRGLSRLSHQGGGGSVVPAGGRVRGGAAVRPFPTRPGMRPATMKVTTVGSWHS